MRIRDLLLVSILTLAVCTSGSLFGQTQTIDFEQFSGPSIFTGVQPPLTVDIATFTGGQLLSETTNLPADQSTVYGTAFFCAGCAPTITIDFAEPISSFSIFVVNGQIITVTYTVADDRGGTQTKSLVANFESGAGTFTLASTGIRKVTITSETPQWDFFIDNITFTSCSITDVTIKTNKNCDPKINPRCTANIVFADGVDSTEITTTVQPPQAVAVDLSTTFGDVEDAQTDQNGVAITSYTSGVVSLGTTATTVAVLGARACNKDFPNLERIFNYRGFDFGESRVSNATFIDSGAMDTAAIQQFLSANGSFLANFVLVGRLGGFVDTNNDGMHDSGEPTYSATNVPLPLHVRGVSAASVFSRIAEGQGINPRVLLVTAEKENSLISRSALPSTAVLNFAMGCGSSSNFVDQIDCAAKTLVHRFEDTTAFGRVLNYPFFVKASDGIRHAVTARCNTQPFPQGCEQVAFTLENAATYAQYRYTPFIQSLTNGGGVYLFETLWLGFGF